MWQLDTISSTLRNFGQYMSIWNQPFGMIKDKNQDHSRAISHLEPRQIPGRWQQNNNTTIRTTPSTTTTTTAAAAAAATAPRARARAKKRTRTRTTDLTNIRKLQHFLAPLSLYLPLSSCQGSLLWQAKKHTNRQEQGYRAAQKETEHQFTSWTMVCWTVAEINHCHERPLRANVSQLVAMLELLRVYHHIPNECYAGHCLVRVRLSQ